MSEVWISPADDLQGVLLELLRSADKTVFCASYTPLTGPVVATLSNLVEKGVSVRVVVDGGPSQGHDLQDHGLLHTFPYRAVEVQRGSMHHKFALVDGDRLLAGSYNLGSSGPYARNFLVRMDQHAERFAVEAEALWMLPDSKRLLLPHQALQLLAVALEPGARRQRSGTEKLLRDIDGNVLRRGWMTEAEEGAVRGIIRKSGRSQPDLPERRDIKGIDTELGF